MENKIQVFSNDEFGKIRVLMMVRRKSCGYKAWLQDNVAWLNANKDNMFSAWDDFVGENNKRILECGNRTAEILEENGLTLDEERKAAMVSNLLVVLCGNHDAQPIVNSGSLY